MCVTVLLVLVRLYGFESACKRIRDYEYRATAPLCRRSRARRAAGRSGRCREHRSEGRSWRGGDADAEADESIYSITMRIWWGGPQRESWRAQNTQQQPPPQRRGAPPREFPVNTRAAAAAASDSTVLAFSRSGCGACELIECIDEFFCRSE